MRHLVVLLFSCIVACAQTNTNISAIYFSSPDEISISAESGPSGKECRVRTLGDNFVFAITGAVKGRQWSGHDDARRVWRQASTVSTAKTLAHDVAMNWATALEKHLAGTGPAITPISLVYFVGPPTLRDSVIASGFFAGTDKNGNLEAAVVRISFDAPLYQSRRQLRLFHQIDESPAGNSGAVGYNEIYADYMAGASYMVKKFRAEYGAGFVKMTPEARDAEVSYRLTEMTAQAHHDELGSPIDELQLVRGKGATWLKVKDGCRGEQAWR